MVCLSWPCENSGEKFIRGYQQKQSTNSILHELHLPLNIIQDVKMWESPPILETMVGTTISETIKFHCGQRAYSNMSNFSKFGHFFKHFGYVKEWQQISHCSISVSKVNMLVNFRTYPLQQSGQVKRQFYCFHVREHTIELWLSTSVRRLMFCFSASLIAISWKKNGRGVW